MDNKIEFEEINLQELDDLKGGNAEKRANGCGICNGRCGSGGCGVTNGKCAQQLEPVDKG